MMRNIENSAWWDWKKRKFMMQLLNDEKFILSNGEEIVIPAQYITDGGTVPKYLRWLIPIFHSYFIAALLHDYLYDTKYISREFADKEMLYWMIMLDVPSWMTVSIYKGIRTGGKEYWNN